MERYSEQVEDLSYKFSSLIAEAFGLAPDGLAHFYDTPQQHRLKISQYPVIQGSSDRGLGPHFDGGLFTFVRFKWNRSRQGLELMFSPVVTSFTSPRFTSTKFSWRLD